MALTTNDSDIWPQRLKFKARLAAFQKKIKERRNRSLVTLEFPSMGFAKFYIKREDALA